MQSDKRVRDIMVGVFDFPHIPYWFSIGQAIKILRVSFLDTKKFPQPMAMLVFDEKYNLMGTLTLKDILTGIEPSVKKNADKPEAAAAEQPLSIDWDSLFDKDSKALTEKPVRDSMSPAKLFLEPGDPIAKAAYLMLEHREVLLPVLEDKRKLVGLVRMIEIFDEISKAVLAD